MPEIRINSKSCPNCGHRNVTEENQLCERCGTSLYKGRTIKWIVSALTGVLLLIATSIYLVNNMGDKTDHYQPQQVQKIEKPAVQERQIPATPPASNAVDKKIEVQPEETPSIEEENQDQDEPIEIEENSKEKDKNVFFAKHDTEPASETSSEDYLDLTRGSQLLAKNLEVHFESKLIRDVEQEQLEWLAAEMQKPSNEGRELTLLSFAEEFGSDLIAKQRARFAQRVLSQKYNINSPIRIKSFGPSKGNSNMRMEAWLK